ncbi:hypothetical protein K402DRAFT_366641 [Aulographum hederae CBS 113979]|uniref:TOG domain-containing protein n=1 Tax=Aulographum hederae CBS 113979 TaxID=1176131 RepID=A0A6G1HGY8_9PEZI|nr:hypothetical protein K402DRAFT_366641 [Aulographum hederae CBS 113979]
MEDQAATLLATLKRSSVSVDAKQKLFAQLKSDIKHTRVPEAAQAPIFECLRLSISSQAPPPLIVTGFATLGHLIKRLSLQDQGAVVAAHAKNLLPILLDRLNDPKDSLRAASSLALADFWPYTPEQVERVIRDGAMGSTHVRAKEMAMRWVVKMNKGGDFHFRSFVPHLVACLEDADAGVRETAKAACVELFRKAPDGAKADLKKQMNALSVRKTIQDHIISQLQPNIAEPDFKASTISLPPMSDASMRDSVMSDVAPPAEAVPMDPLYVHTQRELEEIFRDMAPFFEGKETEQNWSNRDKSVLKLRRLLKGNAPAEFHVPFLVGIKGLMDGILKVANSLRTTMSTNGCQMIRELAGTLGPAMDPMSEIPLQSFIKMTAATKTIASQNGNATVEAMMSNLSYSARLMQHVWASIQDKNVQTRTYAAGWLKILIKKHPKSQFDHAGGLELLDKCIKKGLADANPKVREGTRATYWTFARSWPEKAEAIMESLDPKSKGLLEKDPHNPNASMASSMSSSVGPAGRLRPGAAPSRSSLRDTIKAQQQRLKAAKEQPDRPASAMSIMTPAKQPSTTSLRTARPPSAMASSTMSSRNAAAGLNASGGGLMSAPLRRPRREGPPRPATAAGTYGSSKSTANATPTASPANSPRSTRVPTTANSRSKTPVPKSRLPISPANRARSKSRADQLANRQSPYVDARNSSTSSTPTKDETMTMVVPFVRAESDEPAQDSARGKRAGMAKTLSVDSGMPVVTDDDNFTMVMLPPSMPKTPSSEHVSPQKSSIPQVGPLPTPEEDIFNTPLAHSRSPMIRSPLRSPVALIPQPKDTDADEIVIHEDSALSDELLPSQGAEVTKPVLEELPINERRPSSRIESGAEEDLRREFLQNGNHSPRRAPKTPNGNLNGDSAAEAMRSRKLLASGIDRIRGKNLEAHGFRRLQDIVRSGYGPEVWGESQFGELLLALLDHLEAPAEDFKVSNPSKVVGLKSQGLGTIRAMLERRDAAAYLANVVCAVINARRLFQGQEYVVSELEKVAEDVTRTERGSGCVDAILDLLDSEALHPKSTTMALTTLGQLLSTSFQPGRRDGSPARAAPLSQERTEHLGKLAVKYFNDPEPDVRRADTEFCLALHDKLAKERDGEKVFWNAVGDAADGSKNMIAYYVARRARA